MNCLTPSFPSSQSNIQEEFDDPESLPHTLIGFVIFSFEYYWLFLALQTNFATGASKNLFESKNQISLQSNSFEKELFSNQNSTEEHFSPKNHINKKKMFFWWISRGS